MELKGYEIIREVSRGPITTVYVANQTALDRLVFLKVLNVHIKNESDLLERFRREAKICARLKHPNIVSIFDFGSTSESFFISMEYLEGKSLSEIIQQYHPLPFPVIVYILREIARGLAYAHQFGVIHRDIKPANIMVETNGAVKITDFGLATKADLPTVTAHQSAVGTPAYMSPEQASGKELDPRTDIFSLGATVYEMCQGKSPFIGQNLVDSINKVLTYDPPPLHTIRSDIPEWFSQLVQGMLQKNVEARLNSAEKILENPGIKECAMVNDDLAQFLADPQAFKSPHKQPRPKDEPVQKEKHSFKIEWSYIFVVLVLALGATLLWKLLVSPEMTKEQSLFTGDTLRSSPAESLLTKPRSEAAKPEPTAVNRALPKKRLPEKEQKIKTVATAVDSLGGIFVICTPWAKVFVDGQYLETTPLQKALSLKSGTHRLELKNPNFEPLNQLITVRAGQTDTLRFRLKPAAGTLKIQVVPWGNVYLDDQFMGTTPLELTASAGRHVLKLTNPNFKAYVDTIVVRPGQVLEKRILLKKN